MNGIELIGELLPIILSSAGLTGGIFSAILTVAIKKAKKDAERKREERLKLEILRLEGEQRLSALIFALLRSTRGNGSVKELEDAERAYTEYLENSSRLKNEIIGVYTYD